MTTEEVIKALEEKLENKGFASATDVEAVKASIEELKGLTDQTAIKTAITNLEGQIEAMKEAKVSNDDEPVMVKSLKENMEDIKAIAKGVSTKEVVVKAPTLRASIDGNEQSVMLPDVGQLATRQLSMYQLFPKFPVGAGNHNGTITYYDWDEATTARAAAMVAEGQPFPESTAKWKKYSISLQKVGDTLPVSAEFYEDAVMFAAELNQFLLTNVDLKIDDQICNGDGLGNNLNGLFASVPAFNSAVVSSVPNATFYDLLAVATEQITVTGGAKYMPNFVVMRKSMINKMRLTKDANENYVIPPFVSRDGRNVDGMTVIESNIVPNNQLVLGDLRFARIYEMAGVSLERGLVGDQFVEDMETIKVRKRLLFLIRNVDRTGFVKITNVTAAITAITAS